MTEQHYDAMRRAMVASQLRTTGVDDPRVIAAMGTVPRERFVPPARASLAYSDTALPLADGRALPGPMVLGKLLNEARVRAEDTVLVIGGGAGYAAAVLALLAGRVTALETATVDGPQTDGVTRVTGPLADGWAVGAPYDLILIDGAVAHVPQRLIDQLAEGGRIATAIIDGGVTRLAIGRKVGTAFTLLPFADVAVPVLPGFAIPAGFRF